MARKVSPTRIALLNLKKELKVAQKGHKLLKDKRDGLIKKFMDIIYETKKQRDLVEERLSISFNSFLLARMAMTGKQLERAFLLPSCTVSLDVELKRVMSVPVPEISFEKNGYPFSYGLNDTNYDLDQSLRLLDELLPNILRLAELEKTAQNLSVEIEKTRRRVSALENIMIPELKTTIKFVAQQLEERARDAVVSTMRVKAMIVAKEQSV